MVKTAFLARKWHKNKVFLLNVQYFSKKLCFLNNSKNLLTNISPFMADFKIDEKSTIFEISPFGPYFYI